MIPIAKPYISNKEIEYSTQAIKSGWISSHGEYIDKFENSLKEYLNSEFVTTTSTGTSALHLALLALDIKEGDEVIVPASSFIATLNAVLYVGAKPIFVDIDDDSWGIDTKKLEFMITNSTKAIITVHIYGYSSNIQDIKRISDKYNLKLVEDNAEAFGATSQSKKLGTIGDIGIFSFFGNKIITTGEGGAICTDNKELYEKIKILKNHGMHPQRKYYHEVVGYNYRMTNIQAAIGLAQLENIDKFLDRRKEIENIYDTELCSVVNRQKDFENTKHVNWLYSVVFIEDIDIEKLVIFLKDKSIDSRRLFAPMNKMPYLDKQDTNSDFEIATKIYNNGITLPTYYELKDEEILYICKSIKEFLNEK
jgi:perosamine synthetase